MPKPNQKRHVPPPPEGFGGCDAWDMPSLYEGMRYHRFAFQHKGVIYLLYIKHGCDPDQNSAAWGEMIYCQRFSKPIPEWASIVLANFSVRNFVGAKSRGGRPRNWERDARILVAVDALRKEWHEEPRRDGRKGERRHFAIVEASEKVAEEFAANGEFYSAKGTPLTAEGIESAYYKARERFLVRCTLDSQQLATWGGPPPQKFLFPTVRTPV